MTSFSDSVFEVRGCDYLTQVVIPNRVTSIGKSAFADCTKLISINIPDNVTSIDFWVFGACYKLTIYAVADKKPSGWSSSWNS